MARGSWTWWIVPIAAIAVAAFLLFGAEGGDEKAPSPSLPATPAVPPTPGPEGLSDGGPTLSGVGAEHPIVERAAGPVEPPGAGTEFTGQVVDAEGEPAPGATVDALTEAGVVASATTDAAGQYAFRLAVSDSMKLGPGTLRARGADGSVGALPLYFVTRTRPRGPAEVPAEKALGTIRLRPPHGFDVRVTTSCRDGLPATLWLVPARITTSAPWTVTETDASGAARLEGIPAGRWMLVASSPGCGRVRALVQVPRESKEAVELELPDAHTLTIRVRDAGDGVPIPGASLRVHELLRFPDYSAWGSLVSVPSEYVTDAEGVVLVEGLGGSETLTLRAEAEGYPRGSEHGRGRGGGPGEARPKPGDTEVVIELHRPLTVRWPIKEEGIGVPADGTEVVLEPWTNTGRLTVPPGGVIEDGEIVVDGWGPDGAFGYAVIPGQGIARLSARALESTGYPTAFYPLRRIEAVVWLPDGSPAAGWFLAVRDGGNNAVRPDVETDAEGRAGMEGLYGGPGSLVNVSVTDARGWGGFTLPLGSVNLQKEDGRFEARIPAERTLRVRLTIQGRAVPADFSGHPLLNHRSAPLAEEGDAEPEPGLYVVRWRPVKPEGEIWVSARAAGYLAENKQVSLADAPESLEVEIDLRPAGAARVQVKEPEDKRYKLGLQRWNPEEGAWKSSKSGGGFAFGGGGRADPNGVVAFEFLEPGRYRAVDGSSGLWTEGFDVVAGAEPAAVTMDLRTTGWVKGRVEVPDGLSFEGVGVGIVGRPSDQRGFALPGAPAQQALPVSSKDGTFWVRVPGTRPVTIRLYHATLAPHPTRGQVTLTRPQEGVVLQAIRGAVAMIRFQTPATIFVSPGRPRPVSVRLYQGEVEGEGVPLAGTLDGEHRNVEFGGFDPGTYTVWIDVPGCAPVIRKGVALGDGATDLGEVALAPGAELRIKVRVKEGQSPPRYSVWLQKLDEPAYTRYTDAAGETIRVRGLGAGRFSVHAMAYNGASPGLDEEIEFDGVTEVVRTIDAR